MNSTPTTRPQARHADPAFEQQLREMNETLLISSVRQHELAEQARQAVEALCGTEIRSALPGRSDGLALVEGSAP